MPTRFWWRRPKAGAPAADFRILFLLGNVGSFFGHFLRRDACAPRRRYDFMAPSRRSVAEIYALPVRRVAQLVQLSSWSNCPVAQLVQLPGWSRLVPSWASRPVGLAAQVVQLPSRTRWSSCKSARGEL